MPGKTKGRLGIVGYIRLLHLLQQKPLMRNEFIEAGGIGRTAAWNILGSFYLLGLVHVADWRVVSDSPLQAVFAAGPGPDAPPPATRGPAGQLLQYVPKIAGPKVPSPEVIGFKTLLDAMAESRTKQGLAMHTGLNGPTVRRAIAALVELRMAHIECWTPPNSVGGGPPVPNFKLGPGANAKRPKPVPVSHRQRAYRERAKERLRFQPLASIRFSAGAMA